ncbi:phytoene desaturase [Protomyces lactucae-debilis]|uniref:Phytoene desaturase n=1 Tax=Protomyces lactucae-debilis TaxID=2754530 RepID=A0A1Y2FJV7_PROLT|nr:phytoene desaturase [Protomyces lactucae-debilis]ORY84238.1 phytoene desaturase [Protomyces lactucae-debilis]
MSEKQERQKTALIIGCGVGGVALAARLAHAGVKVTVVEKNSFSGGRCSLLYDPKAPGHRFDRGPSFYLMPKTFSETFEELGEKVADHFDLRKCPRNYQVVFHDGEIVSLSSDMAQMKTEIEKWEGPEGFEGFLAFMKEAHYHYTASIDMVLKQNFESLWQLLTWHNAKEAMRLHVLDKVYSRASRYFKTDRLRRAFTFQSMYLGMSPFDAPATYNLLQYTEMAEGIWYPVGGFNVVVQALERIAKKHGGVFKYNAPVKRINIDQKTKEATGVLLESGEELSADIVVCNADLIYAYGNLLPDSSYSKRLDDKNLTSSSISLYWSMKQKITGLDTHNIFLAEDYQESFDNIFKDHSLPKEPSFYVNVPSRIDPSAAPEDKDSLVILIPAGYITEKAGPQDWDMLQKRARAFVIETLAKRLDLPNFEDLIQSEMVSSPQDWQNDFNLHKGSILGLSHDILQVLWFRPGTRHADYKHLYFVGASTQPGTGVPIVLSGARLTANQIMRDYKIKSPSMIHLSRIRCSC